MYLINLIILLYKFPDYTDKDFKKLLKTLITKRFISCLIIIKNYLFSFNGSFNSNFDNHYKNLSNNNITNLSKNVFYYLNLIKNI